MPPKKGKKGKGKGKDKKKEEKAGEGDQENAAEPTDKETLLQEELDQLTKELDDLKKRVDELRQENEWLQTEAQKIRVENHEYMSYMDKKTSKRQSTIISLSDHNKREIQNLKEEKRLMLDEYQQKKEALQDILLQKENTMSKTQQELKDLQEYKNLQQEQQSKIKELEREVMTMRGKHSEAIQVLKSQFLQEKKTFQQDSEYKVSSMAKQANKEATTCLNDHTYRIKTENRQLRHELLLLIRKTRALNEHQHHLEEQKRELLLEQQYAQDLKTLRSARQHKVLQSFGLLDNKKEPPLHQLKG